MPRILRAASIALALAAASGGSQALAEGTLCGSQPRPLLTWPSKEARLRPAAPEPAPAAPASTPQPQAQAQTPQPLRQATAPAPAPPPLVYPPPPRPQANAAPPAAPASIYDAPAPRRLPDLAGGPPPPLPPPQPQAQAAPPWPPGALTPRRYSVGREFGAPPDPIRIPDPSVMAYSPEVAAAVTAQMERDRGAEAGPASPADMDMLERQQQDADRELAREKARLRAKAAR